MKDNFECLVKSPANYVPLSPLSFLHRAEALYADRPAVIYGDLQRSWRAVADRVRGLATGLAELGIGNGDTVSVLCPNIPELFELHFAVPLAGAVLNTINTRLEAETIAYVLDHSDSRLVIVDRELIPLLRKGRVARVVEIVWRRNLRVT